MVTFAWAVLKIFLFGFATYTVYRWTQNVLFVGVRKPKAWIVLAGIIGIASMTVGYFIGLSHNIMGWVIPLVIVANIGSSPPMRGESEEERRECFQTVYLRAGIKDGTRKARLGLWAFGLCSAAAYVLLYGSACDSADHCKPIISTVLG
ncbi:MAG: hypothetical protein M3O62_09500 [Pseudomonadota bacterium]|nr:hypothetical protein [Pseudomonadota bacterium]